MDAGKVIIETELDTSETESGLSSLKSMFETALSTDPAEKEKKALQEILNLINEIEAKGKAKPEFYESNEYLTDLMKLTNLVDQYDASGVSNNLTKINGLLDDTGEGIKKTINHVGRWGLALFGIRSAYSLIRTAVSSVSQQNQQIGADIDAMKNALISALTPAVEWIVGLMKQLFVYFGAIVKLITGKNIFKSTAKGLNSAVGSAQKLEKILAGFDEMNILGSNTTASGGALGGGITSPDFEKQIDKMAKKIHDWWHEYDYFWDYNLREKIEWTAGLISGLAKGTWKIIDKNVIQPLWKNIKPILVEIKEESRWIWEPLLTRTKEVIAEIKRQFNSLKEETRPIWEPIYKAFIEKFVNPFKQKLNELKLAFIGMFGETINKIIAMINRVIEPLGWHINYIKQETIEAGKTGKKAIDGIGTSVNNVTSKKYKINMDYSSVDNSKKATSGLTTSLTNLTKKMFRIDAVLDLDANTSKAGSKIGNWLKNIFGNIRLPKLASGGIVNNPGAGVFRGNYIAGENGPEAILPLTDDTLQRLANMMPINVSIVNTMNGRVISRELQKVQNNNDFAYNR